ncbi:hypothetical protein ACFXKS_01805 [Streptomyces scopuliridis]|uniref:hypothetical protein n=1 Tax=Streptomyces scopuliridis TaxID=452529 RepID=UPI003693A48D
MIRELAPGPGELACGADELAPGAGELTSGTGELASGTGELAPGGADSARVRTYADPPRASAPGRVGGACVSECAGVVRPRPAPPPRPGSVRGRPRRPSR